MESNCNPQTHGISLQLSAVLHLMPKLLTTCQSPFVNPAWYQLNHNPAPIQLHRLLCHQKDPFLFQRPPRYILPAVLRADLARLLIHEERIPSLAAVVRWKQWELRWRYWDSPAFDAHRLAITDSCLRHRRSSYQLRRACPTHRAASPIRWSYVRSRASGVDLSLLSVSSASLLFLVLSEGASDWLAVNSF